MRSITVTSKMSRLLSRKFTITGNYFAVKLRLFSTVRVLNLRWVRGSPSQWPSPVTWWRQLSRVASYKCSPTGVLVSMQRILDAAVSRYRRGLIRSEAQRLKFLTKKHFHCVVEFRERGHFIYGVCIKTGIRVQAILCAKSKYVTGNCSIVTTHKT